MIYELNQSRVDIETIPGNSLEVQQLELGAFTARARIGSLVGELRSHMLCNMAKNQQQNTIL